MNTQAAVLTGITSERGTCDACGRELGRVFSVYRRVLDSGATATVAIGPMDVVR